jgi:hypothetical protein
VVECGNVREIIITHTLTERQHFSKFQLSTTLNKRIKVGTMFEIITSTANSVSSFGNNTTTTTTLYSVYNATDLWNVSENNVADVNVSDLFHPCDPENPEFNCSIEEYLGFYLGAKQMPLETAIWVSISILKPQNCFFSSFFYHGNVN